MGKGTTGWPTGGRQGYVSEKSGNRSEDLEDVEDAGNWKFLIVEVRIDGDVTEYVRCTTTPEDFDGTEGVEDYSINLAVLYIVFGALSEGNNIAMTDFRIHRVACDITPDCCFLETWHYYVAIGYYRLTIDNLVESSHKIYIIIRCPLFWI